MLLDGIWDIDFIKDMGEIRMNFNSQICTTREQSERLLSLGLKKETADMTWEFSHTKNGVPQYDCRAESSWDSETFARYVEHCEKIGYFEHWKHEDGSQMTPEEVYDEIMKIHLPAWSLHRLIEMINEEIQTDWQSMCLQDKGFTKRDELYDNIVDCIEWLIKEGYFPKEYLVNQAEIEEHCKGVMEYLDYIREED